MRSYFCTFIFLCCEDILVKAAFRSFSFLIFVPYADVFVAGWSEVSLFLRRKESCDGILVKYAGDWVFLFSLGTVCFILGSLDCRFVFFCAAKCEVKMVKMVNWGFDYFWSLHWIISFCRYSDFLDSGDFLLSLCCRIGCWEGKKSGVRVQKCNTIPCFFSDFWLSCDKNFVCRWILL